MGPEVGIRHWKAFSSHRLSTSQEFWPLTQLTAGGKWNKNRDMAGSTQELTSESATCDGKQATDHSTKKGQRESHT